MPKKINCLRHAQAWIQYFDDATPEQRTRLLEIALLGVAAPSGVEHAGNKARVWWNKQQWVSVATAGDCLVHDDITQFSMEFLEHEPFKDDTFIAFPLALDEAPEADDFDTSEWGHLWAFWNGMIANPFSSKVKERLIELRQHGIFPPKTSIPNADGVLLIWSRDCQVHIEPGGGMKIFIQATPSRPNAHWNRPRGEKLTEGDISYLRGPAV